MVSGGPYGLEDIIGVAGYRLRAPPARSSCPLLEPPHRPHDRRARQPPSPTRVASTSGSRAPSALSGDFRRPGSRSPPASSTWPSTPPPSSLYLGRVFPQLTAGHRGFAAQAAIVAHRGALEPARSSLRRARLRPADVHLALALSSCWSARVSGDMLHGGLASPAAVRLRHTRPRRRTLRRDVELHGLGQRLAPSRRRSRIRSATTRARCSSPRSP